MNLLTTLFLESPRTLGAILGLILFGLLVHWRRTLNPRPLLIGLIAAVALMAVERAVETRTETAGGVMSRIERDLRLGRKDALVEALAAGFRADPMDRDGFLSFVDEKLRQVKILSINRTGIEITDSSGERFSAAMTYLSNISLRDYSGLISTRWRIEFVREQGRWKIARIVPTHLHNQPLPGWSQYGGPD